MKRIEIHIELEKTCHLKCRHCSSDNSIALTCPAYTLDNLISFLLSFDHGFKIFVFFTGGEPLLSKNLKTWIQETSKLPNVNEVGIFTSATLFCRDANAIKSLSQDQCDELRLLGLSTCYISIYSSNHVEHDSFTGTKGSFEKLIITTKSLVRSGIRVRFHYVPVLFSQKNVLGILELARNYLVEEIRFLRLVEHGRAKDNWREIGRNVEEQARAVKILRELVDSSFPQINVTVAGFPSVYDCRPIKSGEGCQAGTRLFYLDTAGDIYGCACAKNNPDLRLGTVMDYLRLKSHLRKETEGGPVCMQDL
ncbi:MAG: radical SAM protein [Magnetococcales bacterium]|nr:radical SAM protein [Magnetococcales bacterium]